MNKEIEKTIDFVKDFFKDDISGHDWWHTQRVWKAAQYICEKEKADAFIVEMAALLHDIDDHKFSSVEDEKERSKTRKWLDTLGIGQEKIDRIIDVILTVSFKDKRHAIKPETLEAQIVQDADRLDALGAIGIARTFAYGAQINRPIFDPEESQEENGSSINHFHEKLLLLRDMMNTKTARIIADRRHEIIAKYLREFMDDWSGKDFLS